MASQLDEFNLNGDLVSTDINVALLGCRFEGLKNTKVLFGPSPANSFFAASLNAFNGELMTRSLTALLMPLGVLGVLGAPMEPFKEYLSLEAKPMSLFRLGGVIKHSSDDFGEGVSNDVRGSFGEMSISATAPRTTNARLPSSYSSSSLKCAGHLCMSYFKHLCMRYFIYIYIYACIYKIYIYVYI